MQHYEQATELLKLHPSILCVYGGLSADGVVQYNRPISVEY